MSCFVLSALVYSKIGSYYYFIIFILNILITAQSLFESVDIHGVIKLEGAAQCKRRV